MKAAHWLFVILVAVTPVLAGCARGEADKPKATSTPPDKEAAKDYDIKGKVVSIGSDKRSVTLDHEEIADLMKGMEMKFAVDDSKVLEGIETGDEVTGRLRVQDGKYTITKLEKP